MEYRLFGRTGVKVSPLCLGAMNFGGPTGELESITIIHASLDGGINFIDTANVYNGGQSEVVVGKALEGRRDQVFLATKGHGRTGSGPNDEGNSRLHLTRAVEASLRRLNTDYIDLYQIHRPNPEIPVDETLGTLTDLIRAGKILYIGCSTHPAWRIMEALAISERFGLARYVSEQPPYNLLDRRVENETVPLALKYNLALIPWASLGQGLLAGRYSSGKDFPPDSRVVRQASPTYAERFSPRAIAAGEKLACLANETGKTPGQLALTWAKDQPGITAPIFGPRTLEQLNELIPVLEMNLSEEERTACDQINPPGGVLTNFYNTSGWMKTPIH